MTSLSPTLDKYPLAYQAIIDAHAWISHPAMIEHFLAYEVAAKLLDETMPGSAQEKEEALVLAILAGTRKRTYDSATIDYARDTYGSTAANLLALMNTTRDVDVIAQAFPQTDYLDIASAILTLKNTPPQTYADMSKATLDQITTIWREEIADHLASGDKNLVALAMSMNTALTRMTDSVAIIRRDSAHKPSQYRP